MKSLAGSFVRWRWRPHPIAAAYFEENLADRLMVTCSRLMMLLMTQPKVAHAGSEPPLIVAYHLSAPYSPREGDCDQ